MGVWAYLTGTASNDEQQAQLAAKKAEYEKRLLAREDAGTLSPAEFENDFAYLDQLSLDNSEKAASDVFTQTLKDEVTGIEHAATNPLSTFFSKVPTQWLIILGIVIGLWLAIKLGLLQKLFK